MTLIPDAPQEPRLETAVEVVFDLPIVGCNTDPENIFAPHTWSGTLQGRDARMVEGSATAVQAP